MSQRSKASMKAYKDSQLPTGATPVRTAAHRAVLEDLVDSATFIDDIGVIYSTKVTVSSAEILALNSTPKTLVAAQGAGTFTQLISALFFLDYNSAAYATNTDFEMLQGSAPIMATAANLFAKTADSYHQYGIATGALNNSYAYDNKAILIQALAGDPTTGNSPMYVYLTYKVITL